MAEHKMFDREKVHLNLAKFKKEGKTFEVVVDPDIAVSFREGGKHDILDVLKARAIFSDAKKGTPATEQDLKAVFNTEDELTIATEIVKHGEIQLSAEYRDQQRVAKHKRIVEIIRINSIDPTNKLPHPAARIEAAMEEAKVRVDDVKKAEDQVDDVLHKIMTVLPIKFATKKIQLHLSGEQVGKCYGTFKHFGKILKETWNTDGSWTGTIELPAGLQNDFLDEINKKTQGDADITLLDE